MPIFSLCLPFPELGSSPSTNSPQLLLPLQHWEGREAEHSCSGTRIWALVGDAQRCPGHPDPQFWQRRSLSAATPRKFPPEIGSLPWGQAGFDGTVGQPGKALPRGLTFTSSHHSDQKDEPMRTRNRVIISCPSLPQAHITFPPALRPWQLRALLAPTPPR